MWKRSTTDSTAFRLPRQKEITDRKCLHLASMQKGPPEKSQIGHWETTKEKSRILSFLHCSPKLCSHCSKKVTDPPQGIQITPKPSHGLENPKDIIQMVEELEKRHNECLFIDSLLQRQADNAATQLSEQGVNKVASCAQTALNCLV